MEVLKKRLEDSFNNIKAIEYTSLEISQISEKWAKEIEEMASMFARYHLELVANNRGTPMIEEILRSDLLRTNNTIFEKFLEKYYL